MSEFYRNKKIVVTGGSGFVGTHFVEELLKLECCIKVPIHARKMVISDPRITLVQADLTKQEDCKKALKGADYVIHAAGAVSAAGVTTGQNPMSAITTNLNLTAQILEAAWSENVERVLIFGSSTGYPVTEHPVREDEMWTGPTHPSYFGYGWMRRYLERMSEFVTERSSTKVCLVRPTATYGPYDDFDPVTSHVIPALIRRALEQENPYVIWGKGDEVRDFLYIKDLVRGCLLALEKHCLCDPINIGYGKTITIHQIVQAILNASGHKNCDIQFDASKPTTIKKRMVDTTKAKNVLHFEPLVTLEEGIQATVDWYKSTVTKDY